MIISLAASHDYSSSNQRGYLCLVYIRIEAYWVLYEVMPRAGRADGNESVNSHSNGLHTVGIPALQFLKSLACSNIENNRSFSRLKRWICCDCCGPSRDP